MDSITCSVPSVSIYFHYLPCCPIESRLPDVTSTQSWWCCYLFLSLLVSAVDRSTELAVPKSERLTFDVVLWSKNQWNGNLITFFSLPPFNRDEHITRIHLRHRKKPVKPSKILDAIKWNTFNLNAMIFHVPPMTVRGCGGDAFTFRLHKWNHFNGWQTGVGKCVVCLIVCKEDSIEF